MPSSALQALVNGSMPFQAKVGVRVEAVHDDGVDLILPFNPQNLAVPDILSAGVVFLLGETAGGAILWSVLPPEEFGLVAHKVEIRYLRPSNFDLRAQPRLAHISWETSPEAIRASGRGRATVAVDLLAPDGRPVAKMQAAYTLFRRSAGSAKV